MIIQSSPAIWRTFVPQLQPPNKRIAKYPYFHIYRRLKGLNIVGLSPSRSLRSKYSALLCTPRFNLKTFGKKSFTVAGPVVWNSLPLYLRLTKTLPTFKKNLETFLFDKYLN